MKNVYHVPQQTYSLMFIDQLDDIGYKVIFASQFIHITKGNMIIAKGIKSVLFISYLFIKRNIF